MALAMGPACHAPRRPVPPVVRSLQVGYGGGWALRVAVRVEGELYDFLFDTGTTVHVMSSTFAKLLPLAPDPRPCSIVDGYGAEVECRGAGGIDLTPVGWPAARLTNDIVADVRGLRELRVNGLFSPSKWLLGRGGAIAIDFRRPTVAWTTTPIAISGELAPVHACRDARGTSYYLPQQVAGHQLTFLIDSGGELSGLYDGAATSPAVITIAGRRHELKTLEHRQDEQACPVDGVLGMDFLAHCELIVDEHAGALRCDP